MVVLVMAISVRLDVLLETAAAAPVHRTQFVNVLRFS
jgi:hypothetical protein